MSIPCDKEAAIAELKTEVTTLKNNDVGHNNGLLRVEKKLDALIYFSMTLAFSSLATVIIALVLAKE